ncbi:MAG: hypothetical protein ACP5ON_04620 [Bacteroidota bacterium]
MIASSNIKSNTDYLLRLHSDTLLSGGELMPGHLGTLTPGRTYLLTGSYNIYTVSLIIMLEILKRDEPVVLVDGANQFEVYSLARLAKINAVEPYQILQRVFISRAFTAYQIDSLIRNGVRPFLRQINSRALFVFGLLHTFYDDHVSMRDSLRSLEGIRLVLDLMKKEGISIVFASEFLFPARKDKVNLFKKMVLMSDEIYRLNDESLKLIHLRRG